MESTNLTNTIEDSGPFMTCEYYREGTEAGSSLVQGLVDRFQNALGSDDLSQSNGQ